MSKENVARFFEKMAGKPLDDGPSQDDLTARDVVARADALGFAFTEDELRSHMKEMMHTARSLPETWGWPLARTLGLARS